MYEDVGAGTTFTGIAGVNFWILFEATEQSSGEFVFTLWFKETSGEGQEHLDAPVDPSTIIEEEPESESIFGNLDEDCDNGVCDDDLNTDNSVDTELEFPDDETEENDTEGTDVDAELEFPEDQEVDSELEFPDDENVEDEDTLSFDEA